MLCCLEDKIYPLLWLLISIILEHPSTVCVIQSSLYYALLLYTASYWFSFSDAFICKLLMLQLLEVD